MNIIKKRSVKTVLFLAVFFLLFPLLQYASAQEAASDSIDSISLSDLLNIEISTATKTAMTEQEAPNIVSVITARDIQNMGVKNIEEVLKIVPGFDAVMDYYNSTQIAVRGIFSSNGRNNKIKLMMDGHSLGSFYSGDAFQYFNTISLEDIQRIEIIRGPGSALYGANAFVGVINIITKDGEAPSKVSISGGSYSTYKPSTQVAYNNVDRKIKLYLSANYYNSDGPKEEITNDLAYNLWGPFASSVPGDTTYDKKGYSIKTKMNYGDLYFNGFYHKIIEHNCPIGVSGALSDEDVVNNAYYFAELGYRIPFQDKGSLLIKTYYDLFTLDSAYEGFSEETAVFFNAAYSAMPAVIYPPFPAGESIQGGPFCEDSILGTELTLDYKITDDISLVAGLLYENIEMSNVKYSTANSNFTGAPVMINGTLYYPLQYFGGDMADELAAAANWAQEEDRQVTAAYVQSVIDLAELFSLEHKVTSLGFTAGLRYDDYDDVGSSLNPRAGFVFSPTQKLYFKLLYGTAFRAPSFNEMYSKNNPSIQGNDDIDPETLITAELLIGYNFTDKTKATLTYFNSKIDDLVSSSVDTATGIILYDNLGEMESSGIEAEFKYYYEIKKYCYVNSTYQDVKNTTKATITSSDGTRSYTQKDFFPGKSPKIIGNLGLNYDITETIMGHLWINYLGTRERSEEMKFDIITGELVQTDQRDDIDSQTLVNTTFTFGNFIFAQNLKLQLSCFNIFDEDQIDPDEAGKPDFPRGGRTFYGKVSYQF